MNKFYLLAFSQFPFNEKFKISLKKKSVTNHFTKILSQFDSNDKNQVISPLSVFALMLQYTETLTSDMQQELLTEMKLGDKSYRKCLYNVYDEINQKINRNDSDNVVIQGKISFVSLNNYINKQTLRF